MHQFKRTLKILSSAVLTMFFVYGIYGSFASADKFKFEDPENTFGIIKIQYHKEMNKYFNNKITLFLEAGPDAMNNLGEKINSKTNNYIAPNNKEDCTEKNISTYCVAMGALDIYYRYVDTLDKIDPLVLEMQKLGQEVSEKTSYNFSSLNLPGTLASLFSAIAVNDEKIDQEKAEALKILDMTISAYNEFRLAYPMHLKYKEVIKGLNKYLSSLKWLTYTMDSFPAKFIDATSQSCK